MKIALIGMDIPMQLPALLTDLLFAGKEPAAVAIHEPGSAMRGVLERYGQAIIRRSGLPASLTATQTLADALNGADCVIYAGDVMPATRFAMDLDALSGVRDEDEGLRGQARVNGGLGGLMHTLRAGGAVLDLCDSMDALCPGALVINLGQPLARTTALFLSRGYRCYGLGPSPLKGVSGLEGILKRLNRTSAACRAEIAGLPGFAFLLSLREGEADLLGEAEALAASEALGRLTARWLSWYGAVAVGSIPAHAELLPEQDDFQPETRPQFGETVEQRKERIRLMNTIGEKGASSPEGAVAQGTMLMSAPAIRPMQLALAVLRGEDLDMPAVTRRNGRTLPQLSRMAVVEARLCLRGGAEAGFSLELPEDLADICDAVDTAGRLAAQAAAGDRTALRECVELDPALTGLDRIYCQDVADRMIGLHQDVLPRFAR